jgi:hypothetical protein
MRIYEQAKEEYFKEWLYDNWFRNYEWNHMHLW